jgi:hypothetical protein
MIPATGTDKYPGDCPYHNYGNGNGGGTTPSFF